MRIHSIVFPLLVAAVLLSSGCYNAYWAQRVSTGGKWIEPEVEGGEAQRQSAPTGGIGFNLGVSVGSSKPKEEPLSTKARLLGDLGDYYIDGFAEYNAGDFRLATGATRRWKNLIGDYHLLTGASAIYRFGSGGFPGRGGVTGGVGFGYELHTGIEYLYRDIMGFRLGVAYQAASLELEGEPTVQSTGFEDDTRTGSVDFEAVNLFLSIVWNFDEHPSNSLGRYAPVAGPDADGDGMSDECEVQYGLDPNDPSDAMADADRDGYPNMLECAAGMDPTDPNDPGQ